ncbi:hypothetical protein TRVA0_003S02960 [Trichomonascus vanleenenianus]|uniref:uncharacterized protein n=1 Tax=Trichomonascus vanleenenianus TaxID=2268995 RepID=UPI003ECAE1FE
MDEIFDHPYQEVADYTVVIPQGPSKTRYDVVLQSAYELLDRFGEYIWYQEGFNLNHFSFAQIKCLFGSTEYGGCLEDEWVLVYVLRELSRMYPDIYIKIQDSDGEFLLIEGAEHVPDWISPDIADNRVWLNKGQIVIIPEYIFPEKPLTLAIAVEFFRSTPSDVYLLYDLNESAFSKVENFPEESITDNTHYARVSIPRKLAGLLHTYPQYVAPAVRLFTERDSRGLKPAAEFPPVDVVNCTVRMTRRLYAQLIGDNFAPDNSLSAKLTHAVELLARYSESVKPLTEETAPKDLDFREIIEDLHDQGYFMGHRPSSDTYHELFQQAVLPYITARRIESENAYFYKRVRKLELPTDEEIDTWPAENSDEWLHVDYADLEKTNQPEVINEPTEQNVADMLQKVQQFVERQASGIDGMDADDSSSSDSDSDDEDEEQVHFGPGDPAIDEDDFLEFFLKEALKLSPDQIEQFRAGPPTEEVLSEEVRPSPSQVSSEASSSHFSTSRRMNAETSDEEVEEIDEEDWDAIEQELREKGVLPEESDPNYQVLQNLLDSIKSGGGITGPAATLLGQLGIPIPNPDQISSDH